MRKSTALKTLLRSPLRTMLTFLLIVASSFALFSHVTDYAVTTRETGNAKSLYHAVASLDNEVEDIYITRQVSSPNGWAMAYYGSTYEMQDRPWPTKEQLEEFSSLPGVTLADTRYVTAGRVENYERMVGEGDYGGYAVLEGTYRGYDCDESTPENHVSLQFDDIKVIACEKGPQIGTSITMESTPLGEMPYARSPYTRVFYDGLEKGCRCLMLVKNTGWIGTETGIMFPYDVGEGALCAIDGLPDDYLETEPFARQKGWIQAINHNNYVYDIVYTSDMRAIPDFNEQRRVISEGGFLTAEHTDSCVVSEEFLKKHNLSIGDRISIQLGDSLCHDNAEVFEGKDVPGFEDSVQLAIIGTYAGVKGESVYSYSPNSIYVSSALLPVEVPDNYEPDPSEFSVFVEDADDIETFHEAAEQFSEDLGLDLEFSDCGWLDVKDSFGMGALASLLTTLLYIAGAALALFLAVYLYIGRNKKSYAVMRMLGVPGRQAGNSVLLPFAAVVAFAVPLGGIAGLYYARKTAKKALLGMAESAPVGYVPNTAVPITVVILCLLSELIFVSLTAYFFLRSMKMVPPLELLQEGIKSRRKTGSLPEYTDVPAAALVPAEIDMAKLSSAGEWVPAGNYGAVRHAAAYIWKHMRRAAGKTAVSLVLAAVLAAGIGTFVLARLTYQDAFYELGVKGTASDFIFQYASGLSTSSLVKDFYCYHNFGVRIEGEEDHIPMTVTSDLVRDLGDKCTVDYADGYSLSSFERTAPVCLAGKGAAEKLGISPGDEIGILSDLLYTMLKDQDEEAVSKGYKTYKVIGVVESEDGNIRDGIFTGIRSDLTRLFSMDFPVGHCEFTLADNDRLEELEALLEKMQSGSIMYSPEVSYHVDTGGLSNIERVRTLLESLFPIAVAAAVLIGVSGPLLVILQSAQEAAFLRILGATRIRVFCILTFEQVFLSIAGILLVSGGIALFNPDLFAKSLQTLAACFGLYLLGCVCGAAAASVQLTRGRLLELLQVKE